jgi:hypothetical protein
MSTTRRLRRRPGAPRLHVRGLIGLGLGALLGASGCGAGVPVQLRVDEYAIDLSIDDAVDDLFAELRDTGRLPLETPGLPERWPDELPEVCYDFLAATNPDDGGRIDLTPDPEDDSELADLFAPINDGLIERIELDRLIVRVERNSLNVPLPTIEVQAADAIDANPDDRRAWYTVGTLGGEALSPGCARPADARGQAVEPGALQDLEFQFHRGGESFLNSQLIDEDCLARQMADGGVASPLACKEFSLRARSRMTLDTAQNPLRPRGEVTLRLILVATFFVQPPL